MTARVFLALNALIWIPYGLYCFFDPGALVDAAGVASTTKTGSTEIRAMYGGVQIAIGALCVAGWRDPALARTALVTLAFLTIGLFSTRLVGSTLDYGWSQYTGIALGFEITLAAVSLWLLRGSGEAAPA